MSFPVKKNCFHGKENWFPEKENWFQRNIVVVRVEGK